MLHRAPATETASGSTPNTLWSERRIATWTAVDQLQCASRAQALNVGHGTDMRYATFFTLRCPPRLDHHKARHEIRARDAEKPRRDCAQIGLVHGNQPLRRIVRKPSRLNPQLPYDIRMQHALFRLHVPGIGKRCQARRRGSTMNLLIPVLHGGSRQRRQLADQTGARPV